MTDSEEILDKLDTIIKLLMMILEHMLKQAGAYHD
jgi:hypothetical protein